MRVLQGVTGQAGQPDAIAAGLRAIGIDAATVAVNDHKFGYPADHRVNLEGSSSLEKAWDRIRPLVDEYDVFHFHTRSFLVDWPNAGFPAALDLLLIKMMGKKVFFHFRGQEIRLGSKFAELNPFHYLNEDAGRIFTRMPDLSKLQLRDFVMGVCDGVFVTDPEVLSYVPGATIIPRALDAAKWEHVGVSEKSIPLVIHAPSRRGYKGTDAVLKAVGDLKEEGLNFEFRLVENMPHAEAARLYREADIIIDQLRIGWYGVLGCEAMALGKPVISYIRDDLWQEYGTDLPVVNANPNTIRQQLRELLLSQDRRKELSATSREYFLRTHSATSVASVLKQQYVRCSCPPSPDAVTRYMDWQSLQAHSQNRPLSMLRKGKTFIPSRGSRARLESLMETYRLEGSRSASNMLIRYIRNRFRSRS